MPVARKLKLSVHSHRHTLRGEEVISFLTALLRRIREPIVLVWDHHPVHQRQKVQDFFAQHPYLHVYEFPTGTPELNPMEWVWQHMDDFSTSIAPRSRFELRASVMVGVARVRNSSKSLRAYFAGAKLKL